MQKDKAKAKDVSEEVQKRLARQEELKRIMEEERRKELEKKEMYKKTLDF